MVRWDPSHQRMGSISTCMSPQHGSTRRPPCDSSHPSPQPAGGIHLRLSKHMGSLIPISSLQSSTTYMGSFPMTAGVAGGASDREPLRPAFEGSTIRCKEPDAVEADPNANPLNACRNKVDAMVSHLSRAWRSGGCFFCGSCIPRSVRSGPQMLYLVTDSDGRTHRTVPRCIGFILTAFTVYCISKPIHSILSHCNTLLVCPTCREAREGPWPCANGGCTMPCAVSHA